MAVFLHAAGFHCLTFDVRGHGANPAEDAADQRRRVRHRHAGRVPGAARPTRGDRRRRSSATRWAAIGAILAAAADPRVAALVATSGPADPYRLTRQTFRLAQLPIPGPDRLPARLADDPRLPPAARPRRRATSTRRGDRAGTRAGPAGPRRRGRGRPGRPPGAAGRGGARGTGRRPGRGPGRDARRRRAASIRGCTRTRATGERSPRFLTAALGGPLDPATAGDLAAATARRAASPTARPSSPRSRRRRRWLRTLAQVALPGRRTRPTRRRAAEPSPRRRTPADRRVTDPVWDADPDRASARSAASPTGPSSADHLERILDAGRRAGSSQEPPALGVHRVSRPRAPARARRRSGRGPGISPAPPSGSPS